MFPLSRLAQNLGAEPHALYQDRRWVVTDSASKNKVAVVTGGASGLGKAVGSLLVAQNIRVVLADIALITNSSSNGVSSFKVDVRLEHEVAALMEFVKSLHGRLDFLVNCAGVDRVNDATDATEAEFDWIIGVNLKGTFLCCRAAIPLIKSSGGGAIVNIGSTQGYYGAPRAALYCASKGGVHQLTKCLAIDHAADGIRVNCVAPGAIETPMLARELSEHPDPELALERAMDVPLARIARPEEIAAVVCFLLSEQASYMTGAVVPVDGGEGA
jgi:meso-butanediol dehydrogenase/(S,S)-butanediol dehydrogenase/diacetyl reductase